MAKEQSDKNSDLRESTQAIGRGYMIGVQALAISIEMVLIPAAGLWLDSKLGTGVLFGGIGLVLGMFVGIKQLIRLGETETKNIKNEEEESENDSSSGEQNGA